MRFSIFLILLLSLPTPASAAGNVVIKDRLETYRFLLDTWSSAFGSNEQRSLKSFHASTKKMGNTAKARRLIEQLDADYPLNAILPILYWRLIQKNEQKQVDALMHLMVLRMNTVRDYVDHPIDGTNSQKQTAKLFLRNVYGSEDTLALFSRIKENMLQEAQKITNTDDTNLPQALRSSRYLGDGRLPIPRNSQQSNTYLGFIPGNLVQLVSYNDVSQERMEWLNSRIIFGGSGGLDFSKPYMKMPKLPDGDGHIVFMEDPIYQRIRLMIDAAEDSIFINIFLFGGTLGGTLAKHLLDQTKLKISKNPNFRVLFLHDYATNYNMKEEMMPVFEYIRDRVADDPDLRSHVYLMQANIQRHPPGIPFGLTGLIPKTDAVFNEIEKMNTYYESKIDHSKVIVVDANTPSPKAYFGSKNWTDHSGGYYYDNALYVEGPAAALVQASYYDDIEAALTTDPQERKWFFFKEQGFSNERFLPIRDNILSWFKLHRNSYPPAGDQPVRIAEANVDGKVKDVRNMLIDRITKAKKNIYMEQLFLYDKYIVDALIKRKLQLPNLDIKIIMDHNGNFGMNGLPNTIFLRELQQHGVEVRARRTIGLTTTLKNGETRTYHQENHRKISSIDGVYMMVGSSNLNPDTLQGSFREFGAELFDRREIRDFEAEFLNAWHDESLTHSLDGESIRLKVLGKDASPEVSRLINDLGAMIFRSKDRLENRQ